MLRVAGSLWALLFAGTACAQVSGSVAVVSDYRYRGSSLSDGEPSAQLGLAWDRSDGWYAGVQLAGVRFAYPRAPHEVMAQPYVGYVRQLRSGRTAEAGVQYNWFSRTSGYGYPELYGAFGGDRVRGRLNFTPRYFGRGAAWYGEVDANRPLRGRLRALAHVGLLHVESAEYDGWSPRRWRTDLAAGVGWTVAGLDLQATWTTSDRDRSDHCIPWQCDPYSGWVLRIARYW